MKKVYLHIGAHKTGTTAIQEALSTLQKKGELKKHNTNFSLLADEIHTLFHTNSDQKKLCNAFKDKLTHCIENIPVQNFIFSFEGLSSFFILANPHIVEAIAEVFSPYETTVIYYLRRQDTAYESLWAQRHKHFLSSTHLDPPKSIYKDVLDLYATHFDKKNICLRIYDKNSLYKNNSIDDFLTCVNLRNLIDSAKDMPSELTHSYKVAERENISEITKRQYTASNSSMSPSNLRISLSYIRQNTLSQEEAERKKKKLEEKSSLQQKLFQQIETTSQTTSQGISQDFSAGYLYNLHADFLMIEQGINSDIAFAETLQKLYDLGNKNEPITHAYMSTQMRQQFLEECQTENDYIMSEYLDKKEGNLFDMTLPKETVSLESPTTDDLVKSFLPMLVYFKQNIDSLKKENQNYAKQIQALQKENKKIKEILSNSNKNQTLAKANIPNHENTTEKGIIRLGNLRKH